MKTTINESKKVYQIPRMDIYRIQNKSILLTSGDAELPIQDDSDWPLDELLGDPLLPW
jgi:hypothetical protein